MVQATSAQKKMVYATYPNLADERVLITGCGTAKTAIEGMTGWYGA